MSHAKFTCFDELIAWSVRLSHISLGNTLLLWQLLSISLLLSACLLLCEAVTPTRSYRWTTVAIVTAVLTIPVAGTSLLMMDPYLTPRSLSTPMVVFALVATLRRHYWTGAACLLAISPIHPLMTLYGATFCAALLLVSEPMPSPASNKVQEAFFSRKRAIRLWICITPAILLLLTFFITFALLRSVSPAYHEALLTRSYFFLKNWTWYEWIGIIAPLVLLYVLFRTAEKNHLSSLAALCKAAILFGLVSFAFGMLFSTSHRFESVAEIQPMRAFHSIYVVFFVLLGTVLGRSILRFSLVRHVLLLGPVCLCMFLVQRATFPASRHIQWPGVEHRNGWSRAFVWIRESTPTSAIFALSPDHMNIPGEDNEGFRAVAERSMLADQCKDAGVVTMFPGLAKTWDQEMSSLQGWNRFGIADFKRLSQTYGVSWVVLQKSVDGLLCPYQNEVVLVCRVPVDHLIPEPKVVPVAQPSDRSVALRDLGHKKTCHPAFSCKVLYADNGTAPAPWDYILSLLPQWGALAGSTCMLIRFTQPM